MPKGFSEPPELICEDKNHNYYDHTIPKPQIPGVIIAKIVWIYFYFIENLQEEYFMATATVTEATVTRISRKLTNAEKRRALLKNRVASKKGGLVNKLVKSVIKAKKSEIQENSAKRVIVFKKKPTYLNHAEKLKFEHFQEVTAALSEPFSKAANRYINARWK
jgi:hypothetical protein